VRGIRRGGLIRISDVSRTTRCGNHWCTNQQRPSKKEIHMVGEIFGVDGLIVLLVLVALLFGGAAIPKVARNLGAAKNEFEKGLEAGKLDAS
jgi:mttA/Hcf106 family